MSSREALRELVDAYLCARDLFEMASLEDRLATFPDEDRGAVLAQLDGDERERMIEFLHTPPADAQPAGPGIDGWAAAIAEAVLAHEAGETDRAADLLQRAEGSAPPWGAGLALVVAGPLTAAQGREHPLTEVLTAFLSLICFEAPRPRRISVGQSQSQFLFSARGGRRLTREFARRTEWAHAEAWLRANWDFSHEEFDPRIRGFALRFRDFGLARLFRLAGRHADAEKALRGATETPPAWDEVDVMAASRSGRAVPVASEGGGGDGLFVDVDVSSTWTSRSSAPSSPGPSAIRARHHATCAASLDPSPWTSRSASSKSGETRAAPPGCARASSSAGDLPRRYAPSCLERRPV